MNRRATSRNASKMNPKRSWSPEAFAKWNLWNASGRAGSLRLEARELDHLAPFLGFVCDELSEVGGRPAKRAAQIGKPRLDLGIGKPSVDLLVELVDDLDGCVPWSADTEPAARS